MLKFCRSVKLKPGEAIPRSHFLFALLWPVVANPDTLTLMAGKRC